MGLPNRRIMRLSRPPDMRPPAAFRQRVRKYPRDELLRGIARSAARERLALGSFPDGADNKFTYSMIREGMLFQIAGICVTSCNNYRSARVDDEVIKGLVNGYYNIWPREIDGRQDGDSWQRVLARLVYVQMPYQLSPWTSLMRTLCLLGDDPQFDPPVLDSCWEGLLGVTLPEYLRIGFGMYFAAIHYGGSITRQTLLSDDFAPFFEPVPAGEALEVIDSWLACPVDQLARLGREKTSSADDLWACNPLYDRPIVVLDDGTYVTPSPRGILQRLAPQGLYFVVGDAVSTDTNRRAFEGFTSRLGERYERYIGKQLSLLVHATLHPEISYGPSQKGVDYIIETPEVLILVEAKSAAPTAATRSGMFPDNGDVSRHINKACRQITRTAELIEDGHPNFPDLGGRPLRGLVVTREQYLNLPFQFLTDVVTPASIPTTIVSADQLERVLLSTLNSDKSCGARLLDALASDTCSIKTSLDPLGVGVNPLLGEMAEAWAIEYCDLTRVA